jgi:hypothetical protein
MALSAIQAAEYQGFDDGYFGNARQTEFRTEAEAEAYATGFNDGKRARPKAARK